eukprot:TRINITY_DN4253_c0_g2_i7.p1 TRINITY_DN4253_c0_g2~~TRINITY_DN4253_c0_g2_i7.p1  ORF type:complete len:229 (-),score=36.35 TRINITY_DN4253_c0_g2_i7:429-1115(-)
MQFVQTIGSRLHPRIFQKLFHAKDWNAAVNEDLPLQCLKVLNILATDPNYFMECTTIVRHKDLESRLTPDEGNQIQPLSVIDRVASLVDYGCLRKDGAFRALRHAVVTFLQFAIDKYEERAVDSLLKNRMPSFVIQRLIIMAEETFEEQKAQEKAIPSQISCLLQDAFVLLAQLLFKIKGPWDSFLIGSKHSLLVLCNDIFSATTRHSEYLLELVEAVRGFLRSQVSD